MKTIFKLECWGWIELCQPEGRRCSVVWLFVSGYVCILRQQLKTFHVDHAIKFNLTAGFLWWRNDIFAENYNHRATRSVSCMRPWHASLVTQTDFVLFFHPHMTLVKLTKPYTDTVHHTNASWKWMCLKKDNGITKTNAHARQVKFTTVGRAVVPLLSTGGARIHKNTKVPYSCLKLTN